jgi:hypothetical protein
MSKENQSNLLVTFSNIISNVLNPLFSLLIFFVVYSYQKSDGEINLKSFTAYSPRNHSNFRMDLLECKKRKLYQYGCF